MEKNKEESRRKNKRRILILLLLLLLISGCSYTYLNFFNTEGRDDRGARNPGISESNEYEVVITPDYDLRPILRAGNQNGNNLINGSKGDCLFNHNQSINNRPGNNNRPNHNNNNNNNSNNNPIIERIVTATFVANGASISRTSQSCVIRGSGGSCSVTLPTITRDGWVIVGWSTDPNATTSMFDSGDTRFLTANTRLYAITNQTLTATFALNGADSISATTRECTKWNTQNSCNIITPNIERNNWVVHGWNQSATHHQASGVILEETNTTITSDKTYYAVTSRALQTNFNANGADEIGATSLNCYKWNMQTSCSLTAPSITRAGANIVGWNTDPLAATSMWNVGTSRTISANETWYAITNQTLTATFVINGADAIGTTSLSCTISNAQPSCTLTAPTITRDGWTIIGWNTSAAGTMSGWNAGNLRTISANETWYAITNQALTATFVANGADSIGATSQSCTRWNTNTTCNVFVPFITRAGGSVFGWNPSSNAETGTVAANTFLGLSESKTLYAITNVTHTATFNINGADSIGAASLNCTRWNAQTSCSLTAPSITREGWIPLGWNQSSTATTSVWDVDTARNVTTNETWYAITTDFPTISNFPFTGLPQTVTIPAGTWRLETWGAQGGNGRAIGGRGGYAAGTITLLEATDLIINVGGQGSSTNVMAPNAVVIPGGFNGGGNGFGGGNRNDHSGSGGGATDIRITNNSLFARAIVAGGGAGGTGALSLALDTAGIGGGAMGIDGGAASLGAISPGRGGTQIAGGAAGVGGTAVAVNSAVSFLPTAGTFGQGGNSGWFTSSTFFYGGGGGGGGWFGGGGGQGGNNNNLNRGTNAGGGSGWVFTAAAHTIWANAQPSLSSQWQLTSTHHLSDTQMIAGNASMPNPLGGNMIGNAGNGFARITRL